MNARGNLLGLQGGGATAGVNTSLYGVVEEGRHHGFGKLMGARWGMAGLMRGEEADLTSMPDSELERLRFTPGAYLGSSRVKPGDADLQRVVEWLKKQDIRALLMIGGNGSQKA